MSRWTRWVVAGCALGLGAQVARGDGADGRPDAAAATVSIEWSAEAEDCAGAEALARSVARQVRRNRVVPDGGDVIIRGRTEPTANGWRATIRVVRRDGREVGSRELAEQGESCRVLDGALAVVLAMIVDSTMVDEARDAMVAQAAEPEVPSGLSRSASGRTGLGIVVSAGAGLGRLPGAAGQVDVAARIDPPWMWPIEIGGAVTTRSTEHTADGGSSFRYAGGGAVVCPLRATSGRFAVEPCAGAEAGAITAGGFGFRENFSKTRLMVDARLEVRLELAVSAAWFARASAGAHIPVIRPGFSFEAETGTIEDLFSPEPVSALAQIGIGLRFR